ncbi:hypothetical protein [Streptomyces sp. NPDC050121]
MSRMSSGGLPAALAATLARAGTTTSTAAAIRADRRRAPDSG